MIRKIPISEHYYKEEEIDTFLNNKSDKNHEHGSVTNDGKIITDTSSVNKVVVTDSSNSIKTINKLPLDKITHQDISGKVNTNDIQDNFSSSDSNKPLSAKKGKELKNLVDTKADSENVYTKSQTMTTSEINQAIAEGVGNIDIFEVVQELPTTNIKGNKFYLTPNEENIEKNIYDINIYVNNNWEAIDSLEFDIGNYPTTSEVTVLLNGKVDKIDGKQLSKNDFTDALKNKLENDVLTEHQSLTNYIQKSQTEGFVKNDGSIDTNEYLTEHQSLTNYIQKSQTEGFVRNDGSIDTNEYLTEHQPLDSYVQKSQVSGLIKNDGTIDTKQYLTQHQSLDNYVQKSQTSGLVKNDGTIDTNKYLTKETALKPPNYGYIDSNLILHLEYLGTEISATKTIMQTGENNTITVIVTDDKGNLLENKPVEFYINGAKVGETINTNSSGVASYTYEGSGSGKLEIQIKIGIFVSEIYEVLDCTIIDDNTKNWYYQSGSSGGFTDGVRTFINASGSNKYLIAHLTGGSVWSEDFDYPLCFECNIVSFTNSEVAIHTQSGTHNDNTIITTLLSANCHIKARIDSTHLEVYVNDSQTPSINRTFATQLDGSKMHIGFRASDGTLTFSNFKVYPI